MLRDILMKHRFFITATGTDIGKSFITAGLVQQAKSRQASIAAYKPVASGFDVLNPHISDTGLLLRSLELPLNRKNIERISPWRYAAALAPSMAARLENTCLDLDALLAYSRYVMSGPEDYVVLEGVGGIMTPLTDHKTVLDWIEPLRLQTILVAGTYLGSISHTLTALAVLHQRQIPIHTLIVNESPDSQVGLDQTVHELGPWVQGNLLAIPRCSSSALAPLEALAPLLA